MEDNILKFGEAAAFLKIGKRTLSRLVKNGDVPGGKAGKTWRFNRLVLEEFFQKGGNNDDKDSSK